MFSDGPTSWLYPPALNTTFRDTYQNETMHLNNSMLDRGIEAMLAEAVRNLTLPQRLDSGFQNTGFGGEDAVIRRGDVIDFDWRGATNRTVQLNCVVCSAGPERGAVENACNNYTSASNMSTLMQITNDARPNSSYQFPSLESYFALPTETCGLCIFTLYSYLGHETADYSVPFPVLQQAVAPFERFNTANPTGVEDSNIRMPTSSEPGSLQNPTPKESGKPNVDMIVGVVVGVLGAVILLALSFWLLWRKKRKAKTKVVHSSSSSAAHQSHALENAATRHMQLQRIQGVVRRPETNHGEVPPTYHEAVWESSLPQPVESQRYR